MSPPPVPPPVPWPAPAVVDEIRRALKGRSSTIALVLGSGLGGIAAALEDPWTRKGETIPGYPRSTVAGHSGSLLLGRLGGREIWVVQGRVHIYEGYTAEETTRYVRLLHALGVDTLVLTNAAGSVDRAAAGPGDVVLCRDAVNLFFRNLVLPAPTAKGPGVPSGGSRPGAPDTRPCFSGAPEIWRPRPPLSDPSLARLAEEVAREERIPLRSGVLVASPGPCYETAAEVAAWRRIGGTVASMSTVPEALVARELGMRCLLFSLVTNFGTGLSRSALTHQDVVEQAGEAGVKLALLLTALVPRL